MMVDCEEAQAALLAAGMEVESPAQRVLDIADANGGTILTVDRLRERCF